MSIVNLLFGREERSYKRQGESEFGLPTNFIYVLGLEGDDVNPNLEN
ncbi:MAG: hypothetical protein H2057_05440 [Alphaproteobacteria bacterium]|nr:hypothetical protein [Alphaproteobacteria bacterium]